MEQQYVSAELTHFVGKGMPEEKQYRLLIEILESGWLTHPPHNPNISGNLSVDPSGSVRDMYNPQVVCFCDIPIGSLSIHMGKYSRFGIAFGKPFLIGKVANPVFYVAENAVLQTSRSPDVIEEDAMRKDAELERLVRQGVSVDDALKQMGGFRVRD